MAFALQADSHPSKSGVFLSHQDRWPNSRGLAQEAYPGELEALRQQKEQNDNLIELMPAGIIILDGNGVVIKVNRIASDLLEEPILGEAWFNVIKNSFKPRADDWHEVSLKDGRRVKLDIMPLKNQPGQLILITDLTETRLMQDKMAQMQRLSSLGKMVSSLAHQIRTPLSAAMLYGANMGASRLSSDDKSKFQSKLMARLGELEQQVNDMLLFAKSGNQQVVKPININTLVKSAVASIETQLAQSNSSVDLSLADVEYQILGNEPALIGALQNLMLNSIDIIKSNAVIQVATYCQNNKVMISIRDNGPGIDQSIRDKIFDPFVTSRAKGTGLGLAVVKAVSQAHQGDVKLLSQSNEGAHFCIQIPLFEKGDSSYMEACL